MKSPDNRSWWLRGASYCLIAAGLGLLIYVSTQYLTMYREQRRLVREWQQQQDQPLTSVALKSSHNQAGLTRITIARINLDAVVTEGTGRSQLLVGPGHMQETAEPGEPGNTVITAHRDTFFRHIYELNPGDMIELRRNGALYRYVVTGKRVVAPSDLSVAQPTPDARLTLITCYPTYFVGPAPERLVVFSRLLEQSGTSSSGTLGNP